MKQFYPILSAAFAVMVLFSSTNFTVELHICSGQIQDVAVFSKAKGCSMINERATPCKKNESKHCCEDETIVHDGKDFQANLFPTVDSPALASLDILAPATFISEIIPSSIRTFKFYADYDPPAISKDITSDLQVFLI